MKCCCLDNWSSTVHRHPRNGSTLKIESLLSPCDPILPSILQEQQDVADINLIGDCLQSFVPLPLAQFNALFYKAQEIELIQYNIVYKWEFLFFKQWFIKTGSRRTCLSSSPSSSSHLEKSEFKIKPRSLKFIAEHQPTLSLVLGQLDWEQECGTSLNQGTPANHIWPPTVGQRFKKLFLWFSLQKVLWTRYFSFSYEDCF